MQTKTQVIGIALLALSAGAATSANAQMMDGKMMNNSNMMSNATNMVASWPMDTKKAAKMVMTKFGAPDEATASMLVWHNKGPWKRIIASRTMTTHKFPAMHPDSVEEFVDYRVPLDKYDDLARFDGSVNVDRTRGEISARCDADTHNFLALNLAHDIIVGKRSVANARAFYGMAVKMEKEKMKIHPYMMRLNFQPHRNRSADADKVTIHPKK